MSGRKTSEVLRCSSFVCSKLKRLKKVLGKLNSEHFYDLSERVRRPKDNLSRIQQLLQVNPADSNLWKEEAIASSTGPLILTLGRDGYSLKAVDSIYPTCP